jgi:hypothetical protein
MSVSLSASATGFKSLRLERRQEITIGIRPRPRGVLHAGTAALTGGWKDHQALAFSVSYFLTTLAAPFLGSGAPICTHFSKSWITASGSLPPDFSGGMEKSLFV